MNSTLTLSPPATSQGAGRLAAKRIWANLGPGSWTTPDEKNIITDEMLSAIIAASPGMYAGDLGGASARRRMLVSIGALQGTRHDDNSITWVRSETFPEPEGDSLSWVERENARLEQAHKRNLSEMTRDAEVSAGWAETLDAPEQGRFLRRLHKAGVTPDQIREIVRAEVTAALEEHFAPVGAE